MKNRVKAYLSTGLFFLLLAACSDKEADGEPNGGGGTPDPNPPFDEVVVGDF